jgi:hypothetical protein
MSLRLTKPGASVALRNPKTGAILEPLGYTRSGRAIMPILGASSDDPDDPAYTGGGPSGGSSRVEDDDEDEEDQDDDKDDKSPPKKSTKSNKSDDDEDDEDEDDKPKSRPERQAARYRIRLREAEARERDLNERLRKLEDTDKPKDEILKRDLTETRERAEKLESRTRALALENAFLRANDVQWNDSEDALKLIDFDEIDVDEDGTVDARQLRRALRDLAKRKPHLVKKTSGRDEDADEDAEQSSRSGSAMNGTRRGSQKNTTDRASLAKRFPVIGR